MAGGERPPRPPVGKPWAGKCLGSRRFLGPRSAGVPPEALPNRGASKSGAGHPACSPLSPPQLPPVPSPEPPPPPPHGTPPPHHQLAPLATPPTRPPNRQAEDLLSDGVDFILEECDKNGDGVIDRDELLPMIGHWLELAQEALKPPPPPTTRASSVRFSSTESSGRNSAGNSAGNSTAPPAASRKYLVEPA